MNKQGQKPICQNRIETWLLNLRTEDIVVMFIVGSTILIYGLFLLYPFTVFLSFLTSWSAGLLGILTGFALDRKIEGVKENRVREDFLALMRNELTETKGKIPPQTKTPVMLYPEVWDSFVASGLMRLLSAEQVVKLSSVYRFVKGTQYEAEWVRRRVEEHESIPDTMRAEKETSYRRYRLLQDAYERHGNQLSQQIEKILGEEWLSRASTPELLR